MSSECKVCGMYHRHPCLSKGSVPNQSCIDYLLMVLQVRNRELGERSRELIKANKGLHKLRAELRLAKASLAAVQEASMDVVKQWTMDSIRDKERVNDL